MNKPTYSQKKKMATGMMQMQKQLVAENCITLSGSAQMVSEFFYYGINSILYQRGVYPTDTFKKSQKYGLTLLVSSDEKLNSFLETIQSQIELWLTNKQCRRLVIVISDVASKNVLERWQFDVKTDDDIGENGVVTFREKSEKKIREEMRDVIRQITASVTFLPLLENTCSFDVLIYTTLSSDVPDGWGETGPSLVLNGEEVKLRSFSTGVHAVDAKVVYKLDLC